MIYVFYEKLPFYDLSSHTHKFIKEEDKQIIKGENNTYNTEGRKKPIVREKAGKYETPLPVSVVKEEKQIKDGAINEEYEGLYGGLKAPDYIINNIERNELRRKYKKEGKSESSYEPPLPVSVIKEDIDEKYKNKGGLYSKVSRNGLLKAEPHYEPPLPVSVVKEEMTGGATGEEGDADCYNFTNRLNNGKLRNLDKELYIGRNGGSAYEPPLPVSVVKEEIRKDKHTTAYGDNIHHHNNQQRNGESIYDPPLPNSMLEIKSTRGKHSTEKPVALMEWVLKYYSKEGDTILDPTMGSGSTGVACKNMNRNFIGIEMDDEIYEVAVNRIEE